MVYKFALFIHALVCFKYTLSPVFFFLAELFSFYLLTFWVHCRALDHRALAVQSSLTADFTRIHPSAIL
jgi:hypothetical protein